MASGPYRALTGEQVQHFLERGNVVLEQVLSPQLVVLRALEVDRLEFRPTAPRERVVPEREARQAKMLAEEKHRLGIG